MKYKIKMMSKRTISFMLALVLALGCFLANADSLSVKANENYLQQDQVLSELNYDNVVTASDVWGGFVDLSCQMYPKKEGNNGYLYYAQSTHTVGVLRLGHTYTNKSLTNYTPITVVPGQTYQIDFDYRLKPYLDTTQYPDWPMSDLNLGVAVGSANETYGWINHNNYLDTYTSYHKNVEVLATTKTQPNVDWTHKQITITIPENCNVTKHNALQLYVTTGQRCGFHIDNVKVTALAGITVNYNIEGQTTTVFYGDGNIPTTLPEGITSSNSDGKVLMLYEDENYKTPFSLADYQRTGTYTTKTIYGRYEDFRYDTDVVLFENDYSTASAKPLDANAVTQPWLGDDLFNTGGDLCVMKDPADDTNKVVHYSHYRKGFGMLVLGDGYENDKIENYIEVKKGVTYKVDFKWKASGTPANNNLIIGLGLNNGGSVKDVTEASFLSYLSQSTTEIVLTKDTEYNTDWANYTAYFTVDSETDLTKGDRLVLYGLHGKSKAHVYIDDIKVTALAGVTVDYVVGDNTVSVYYADGMIPSTLPEGIQETDASGNTLALYSDATYQTQFVAEDYIRTGTYTTVTLYGKYEKFAYKTDTVLADSTYGTAVIPAEQLLHKNSGDLQPVKDPGDATDIVLRYKQRSVGLGVVQLGYDYTDMAGTDNLTDYVRAYNGVTYKITFDYLVQGTVKDNALEIGIAIGAPNYDYGWPEGVSQTNYLKEHVTWYQQLMSFPINESVDTGWKTETIFVTVSDECDLSKYNALQLYGKGGSKNVSVYFDNVKVIGLADRTYTVKFDTNGGNAMSDKTVDLAGLNNLPAATRSNAVFMGWYLDAELKTPFNLEQCIETTKPITVYAKWHVYANGTEITFDDTSYWENVNGVLVAGRLNYPFVPESENGNNVMKYSLQYSPSNKENVEERGNVKFHSDVYPQRMTLYNPDLTVTGEYDYMDVTYRAKVGKTYKVSFQYKVTGLDTEHSDKGIGFSVLTGNIRNSHDKSVTQSNRFVVENTTTGWKTAATYFTVNSLGENITEKGVTYYSDAIMLGISGYGTVLIDNVSVTDWDIEAPTYIEFSTRGGEPIPAQEYVINANTILPKAVRKGYTFEAWYLDAKCTKKFNPATYKRSNGMLVLYAGYKGMQGVTEIDFENYGYYLSAAGTLQASRVSEAYTPYEENGNTSAKFSLKYSTNKKEEFNNCQGNFGTYGAVIGLYDPAVLESKNWTYEDASLCVEEGQKYWISFQYKALSVDTESTFPSAVTFGLGVTKENSVHAGRQLFKKDISPVDAKTDGWVTASTYFTVPKLTAGGNRLSLFTIGYGEVLIDNIKVIQLTDAVIFDTDGGNVVEPLRGKVGQTVTLPKDPTRADSKFVGWCTDANRTQDYSVAKMEKGVKVLYAKFLTYQTIQDFEHYSVGLSNRFESDYFLNKKTNDTEQTEYQKWLGSKFNADHVRNGKVSVQRKGDNQYSRLVGLFYMNNPLTVGETYELSVWVKVTDYFLAGDIQIVHSDNITDVRTDDYWNESQREARFETIANTEIMSEYMNEWLEIKYTFTAKARYIGLATPGITSLYIDDACITHESADESYVRSIEGDGIKYEDWYREGGKKNNNDEDEEEFIMLDLDGNRNLSKVIIAIVCGVSILAMAGVIVFLKIKKKRGANKNEKKIEA